MDNAFTSACRQDWSEFRECLLAALDQVEKESLSFHGEIETRRHILAILLGIRQQAIKSDESAVEAECRRLEGLLGTDTVDKVVDKLLQFVDQCRTIIANKAEFPFNDQPTSPAAKIRCLIVEDDFASRLILQKFLADIANCYVVVNGTEAVQAFTQALDSGTTYDLLCLDIMMPEMDGREALRQIRRIEESRGISGLNGVKVIMTTALSDSENIMGSFREGCESYIVKPIMKAKLLEELEKLSVRVHT